MEGCASGFGERLYGIDLGQRTSVAAVVAAVDMDTLAAVCSAVGFDFVVDIGGLDSLLHLKVAPVICQAHPEGLYHLPEICLLSFVAGCQIHLEWVHLLIAEAIHQLHLQSALPTAMKERCLAQRW